MAYSSSRSKALLYVCTRCRAKGSLPQRLFKLELENAHLSDEWLASVQSLHETTLVLEKLRVEHEEEKARLQEECHELRHHVTKPAVQKAVSACDVGTMTGELVEQLSHEMNPLEDPSSSSSNEEHPTIVQAEVHPRGLQPRGFKELRFRIDKFSGKGENDDFEVWVEDYKEATTDCGWTDEQRAHWFSWFLSGPAKATCMATIIEGH